jgi:YVTN family beta-propeller protein
LLGSLAPSIVTTDALGIARVTSWTLAALAGLNTLDATVPGLAGSPMTFSANGITTTATNMVLNAGNGQSGVVGTVLATAYSVAVKNVLGLPVQGVQVHWAAGPAGGSMNPATSLTDVNGIASSSRTLGPGAVTQTATASVGGLTGSPVTFTATALPAAAAQLVKQSVDPQTGTVATAVTAPVVKVVDQFGNGVAGLIVNFAPAGGGTIGATQGTSDALGLVSAGSWTLGSLVGTNTVAATAGTLPSVTFSATSVAGPPSRLAFLTEPSRALAGDTIAPAVQVAIQDQYGNAALPAKDVVSLRLGITPNAAAKLQGIVDVAAVNGVASFANLAIDSAGIGYTIVSTSGSLTSAESKPFDIGGVIKAIPVTRLGPVAAALNTQTKKLYVPGASLLSVLLDDKERLPQLTGFESPFGVVANATTNKVYVSTLAGVTVIDGAVDVARLVIPVGTGPKGLAVDERTNVIYVAASDPLKGGPALIPVDGSKDIVVSLDVVPLPAAGMGVAFNSNDGLVYVAIPTLQEVDVINPKPGGAALVRRIQGLGKGTYGVAVDTRTNRLYVTNRDENTVSVIDVSAPDPAAFKEIARLPVGRLPEGVGIDPDRGVAYVGNSGESTVSLIDGGKLNVFATLIVGPTPKAAVVDPVTGRVYVATKTDDLVRVIQP